MRKSSIGGRRGSQPVRMDSDDLRASISRRPMENRRASGLAQPGFATKGRRSSSENRNRMSALPPMKRSKSQLNMNAQVPSNCVTPSVRDSSALKFGTGQSQRGHSPFSSAGPSYRKSPYSSTAKTSIAVKDTRPLTEKAFQQQEIQKISSFLSTYTDSQSLAPKGINLKQLTTKLFVDIVNHLLGFVDSKISVNMTNYVSEIPLIMKRWGYVGNLNMSWLKTVNTPHAFPHVLGLLSFLVNLVSVMMGTEIDLVLQEAFRNNDEDDEAFPYGNAALYMDHVLSQYGFWCKNDVAAEEKEEMRFIQDLANRNGVGEEQVHEIAEDVHNLESQLNDPKEKAEMDAILEDEKKFNECLNDYKLILDYKNRMDEHLNTVETELEESRSMIKTQEEALHEIQNGIRDLKERIKRQTMTAQERDEIIKQCNEIGSSIRENEEYLAAVSSQIYTHDLEMVKKRTNMKKKTQAYNKIIVLESCWFPELKALQDDTNVLHPGAKEELEQIDALANQLKSDVQKKMEDLSSHIKQLNVDLLEVEGRKMATEQEQQQFEEKVKQITETMNAFKLRTSEETLETKKKLDYLKKHLESCANSGTLEEAKAKLQHLINKREYGKAYIEKNEQKALIFFQKSAAITQKLIDTVTKAEQKFFAIRDEHIQKAKERNEMILSELARLSGDSA